MQALTRNLDDTFVKEKLLVKQSKAYGRSLTAH